MLKVIQGLALMAILGLLAVGCGTDHNPVGSPSGSGLGQNNPQSPSMLGNRVWNDVDKDGLQDDTLVEPGIAGVSVSLYTCADARVSTVVTNTKGLYFFPMLQPGTYYIKYTLPQGYVFAPKDAGPDSLDSDVDPTTGKTDCLTLAISTSDLTWDAGLYQGQADTVVNGTVGGRVWFDANQDGIQNESMLGDVVGSLAVELFTCADSLAATTQTDPTGEYEFVNLTPGQYYLLFTPPAGYEFSPNNVTNDNLASDPDPLTGKTICFNVDSAGVDTTWDAGVFPRPVDTLVNGTVGGRVWFDANKDGIQNDTAQSAVVDSLPVKLFTCAGAWVATARTGLTGDYEFTDLVPGQYFLLFTLPTGYKYSPKDAADDSLDSDPNACTGKTVCFQVDSAEVEMTWDAGIWNIAVHGCTHSIGYWKNHAISCRQKDIIRDLLPLWLGSPDGA
ncbi:MAG: SdrD B-like domain-containing protein, partial [candidate division Zixibacteria bacterium]|nr:SdrD B-like domain-containing protein [candidate division Zixibacteria bacterium]